MGTRFLHCSSRVVFSELLMKFNLTLFRLLQKSRHTCMTQINHFNGCFPQSLQIMARLFVNEVLGGQSASSD